MSTYERRRAARNARHAKAKERALRERKTELKRSAARRRHARRVADGRLWAGRP